jgi:hypothetical protein
LVVFQAVARYQNSGRDTIPKLMPKPSPGGLYHFYNRDPRRWVDGERADDPDSDSHVLIKHGASRATAVGSARELNNKVEQLADNGNLTAVFYWQYRRGDDKYEVQLVKVNHDELQQGKDWPQIGPV